MLPVIAIVGPSDSGKTRVAAAIIQRLAGRGYRIVAVKHSPHGHQADRPDSDTARLFAAGAKQVIASSPGQMTSFERRESEAALEEIVASLDFDHDLVVAEGFKESRVPKVLVLGTEPLSPRPQNVIAVVGDREGAEEVPRYAFERLEELANLIQERLLGRSPQGPAISLVVDGVPIPLRSFPSRALIGIIRGFLRALKNVPKNPREVRLALRTQSAPDGGDKKPSAP